MPVPKLKNLILLILAVCLAFLLALVVPLRLEQARGEQTLHARLEELFASYDIRLAASGLPESVPLYALELSDRESASLAAAKALLGEDAAAREDSSRFSSIYSSGKGTCTAAPDGSFSVELAGGEAVSDPLRDAKTQLNALGFTPLSLTYRQYADAEGCEIQAQQSLLDVPIFSEGLRLRYRDKTLTEIQGEFFPVGQTLTRVSEDACISCSDALVAFLSARDSLGWVGSAVLDVRQGYRRGEAAPTAMRLIPVWRITTDTGIFEVHGLTREIRPI